MRFKPLERACVKHFFGSLSVSDRDIDLPKNLTGLSAIEGIDWISLSILIDKNVFPRTLPLSMIRLFDFDAFKAILALERASNTRFNPIKPGGVIFARG